MDVLDDVIGDAKTSVLLRIAFGDRRPECPRAIVTLPTTASDRAYDSLAKWVFARIDTLEILDLTVDPKRWARAWRQYKYRKFARIIPRASLRANSAARAFVSKLQLDDVLPPAAKRSMSLVVDATVQCLPDTTWPNDAVRINVEGEESPTATWTATFPEIREVLVEGIVTNIAVLRKRLRETFPRANMRVRAIVLS